MNTNIVTIGKFKGKQFNEVPIDYAIWQKTNGNKKFYFQWLKDSRFIKHTYFISHKSIDGRWMETRLDNGDFVFYVELGSNIGISNRLYYIVDKNGYWVKDLLTFGDGRCKQGAIDNTESDFITLHPNGNTIKGKMIVSPYYQHFPYQTYRINK